MRKTFEIEDLDCAHCAAKMEEGIRKLEGVTAVTVGFLTQRLTLEAPDEIFNDVLKQALKICKKTEPDCTIKV